MFKIWDFDRARPVGKPMPFRQALDKAGELETARKTPFLVLKL